MRSRIQKAALALQAAAILAAAIFVYGPALRGGWLWDDDVDVTGNHLVHDAAGLPKIWFDSSNLDYYPLKASVEWLEWRVWGDDPTGYHVVNLLLQMGSALLFWRILARLGVRSAWIGGLLFVVHPVAVESVAWISELKNTLSLPFLLLSFDCFLNYDERGSRRALAGSCALFFAALLCKSSVVMMPFVILLYAGWKRGQWRKRDIGVSAPYFALSLVMGLVTVWFQAHRTVVGTTLEDTGLGSRLLGAFRAVGFYFSKAVWPSDLMPVYPRNGDGVLEWAGFGAFLFLGFLGWRKWATWGRHLIFGLGYFFLSLVPVLGFVPMAFLRIAPESDHLAYLALLGVVGLAAAGIGSVAELARPSLRTLNWIAVGAIVAVCAWTSRTYASQFRDEGTLWAYAVRKNPETWLGHYNLAVVFRDAGRTEEAISQYREAVRIKPDYPEAECFLGVCLAKLGRENEAVPHYEAAVRIQPNYVYARTLLGEAYLAAGRPAEAVAQFQAALSYNPNYYYAENNLANALAAQGNLDEAIRHYRSAIGMNPDNAELRYNLGLALVRAGRGAEAAQAFQDALRLDGGYSEAHFRLGIEWVAEGRISEAIEQYRLAIEGRPHFPEAEDNLGVALAKANRIEEAITHFEQAISLRPDYAKAHRDLGMALRLAGRLDEAAAQSKAATDIEAGVRR